jgi:hypothetical protein
VLGVEIKFRNFLLLFVTNFKLVIFKTAFNDTRENSDGLLPWRYSIKNYKSQHLLYYMPFHNSNVERDLASQLKRFKEPAMTLCLELTFRDDNPPPNCLLLVRMAFIVSGHEHPVISIDSS